MEGGGGGGGHGGGQMKRVMSSSETFSTVSRDTGDKNMQLFERVASDTKIILVSR